ncbi:hypothetical protein MFM001_37410 [Mycobacterium sp. MFM001]|uniref:hypothetical protein n=1 Tax=Mycobacterium sp. MFM001 TaxID=2049453 RepID=UPI000DA56471|nr:hypothetical protein [Mycobacterium sp. MFM001]GBE67279.1 hypothetical protein MFM001_37410 [Mycobacterium sp. MFM001]
MKDKSFAEEREVRIVQPGPLRNFFTPSKYGMMPRVKIPLVDGALTTITVGPGAHADLRMQPLAMYVERNGFKGIKPGEGAAPPKVLSSSIPYSDW